MHDYLGWVLLFLSGHFLEVVAQEEDRIRLCGEIEVLIKQLGLFIFA